MYRSLPLPYHDLVVPHLTFRSVVERPQFQRENPFAHRISRNTRSIFLFHTSFSSAPSFANKHYIIPFVVYPQSLDPFDPRTKGLPEYSSIFTMFSLLPTLLIACTLISSVLTAPVPLAPLSLNDATITKVRNNMLQISTHR